MRDGLKGIVKGISTKTKMDTDTGAIEHITSVKIVFNPGGGMITE